MSEWSVAKFSKRAGRSDMIESISYRDSPKKTAIIGRYWMALGYTVVWGRGPGPHIRLLIRGNIQHVANQYLYMYVYNTKARIKYGICFHVYDWV